MNKLKSFFAQDNIVTGLVAGLGSEVLFCLVLVGGLLAAGQPIETHLRWFGGMFIPVLLILRAYAKRKEQPRVTKTLATVFFVTFIAFMAYLLGNHILVLK